jgi:hypothetical protein
VILDAFTATGAIAALAIAVSIVLLGNCRRCR